MTPTIAISFCPPTASRKNARKSAHENCGAVPVRVILVRLCVKVHEHFDLSGLWKHIERRNRIDCEFFLQIGQIAR
jgi:hypothetical protein